MNKLLTINCDGGSRGNPGPAACAFVVSEEGKEIFSKGTFLGETTNNVAEYNAVLTAFEWLSLNKEKYKDYNVTFILDSELVVRQLTGVYKIKNENLKELAIKIKLLENKLPIKISFTNVLREKNKSADLLVNTTLDSAV